ncbi:putative tRNA (uracil(54)-C(5))-methyltransferase transcription factor C3H family [Lupinus albus]|uniref:Putative tRNA (Uracil(54)-C(5))-methyltransferase transcription factor C3H family n=1 Tax=Lupinus albus TaxID=3870 RepID=A0A6A4R4B8_LUPAL|nr:putative tRNA (uracil(54)-C(5))-methyltransferase transcription factor C3H family [Lupinus albus]
MAEPLLNTDLSSPKTLNPINAHDSTSESHPTAPNETQVTEENDAVVAGEKRKRDDGDDRSLHPMWKTSLCSFFRRQDKDCSHGDACRYAHTEEELRPRPDNTWDPTSERAKKALKTKAEEKNSVLEDVMVTEALVDDDDDGDSNNALSKCLVHLPKMWCSSKLKSFLNDEGIPFKLAKKKKGMALGFLTFEDENQMKSASKDLDGKLVGGGGKRIKVADVIPRSFEKKSNKENTLLDAETNGDNSKPRNVRDVVTPLAHMDYADQLEQKKTSLMQMLKKLTRNARKACPDGVSLPEWVLKSREIGGLPCELEGIIASPLVNGYRNKCEFSVGYSLEGKVTVGFMLGNFREGVTAVEEAVDCPNVSAIARKYATIFQEFLQHSDLPVWNRFKNNGFWRQLTVREGRTNGNAVDAETFDGIAEVMLMVQVSTSGVDDAHVAAEFKRLAEAFVAGATSHSPSLPLTALVVQDHQGISNVAPADAPLCSLHISKAVSAPDMEGKNAMDVRIHDYVSNLRFSISPTAFFQVNTLAAEKLYSLAGDWAQLGPDTLLFDICCGTGTIGLTLAHRVGMVIGIEMNASAVSDAHRNAEINGIKNCRFICSKAEDVMGSLLTEYLNVPKEEVDDPNISGSNIDGSEGSSCQEPNENGERVSLLSHCSEINSADNDASEASASEVPENGEKTTQCSENDNAEIGSGVQKCSSSENGNSSLQQFKNVVAIVDPPRAGLHPTVIKALRTHPGLRRLVYISCNPESLVANAIELCTPSPEKIEKGNKGNRGWRNMSSAGLARHRSKSMPISEAFKPVKAMAVDLFPHTPHCELVMLLER